MTTTFCPDLVFTLHHPAPTTSGSPVSVAGGGHFCVWGTMLNAIASRDDVKVTVEPTGGQGPWNGLRVEFAGGKWAAIVDGVPLSTTVEYTLTVQGLRDGANNGQAITTFIRVVATYKPA